MNIAELVDWRSRKYANKIAIKDRRRSLTFSEIKHRADRFVSALNALGAVKGDHIAILSETGVDYSEITLSVPCGGMVLVPLNNRFVPQEIAYTINDCEAKILIIGMEYAELIAEIRPLLKSVKHVVLLGAEQDGMMSYEQLIASSAPKSTYITLLDTDPAYIIYTSGTTSKPKGVVRSHKSIISTAIATSYHHGVRTDDVCYLPNPPFHISFVWPLVTYYCMGCTTIVERWNTLGALKTISTERVSFGVFVPFFIRSLLDAPESGQFDLSSLRRLSMGSAPMDESLARRAVEVFGNIFNYNYGMTEYGSPITMIHGDSIDLSTERGRRLLSSVGKAVFNADVRVVNADGNDVKTGEAGEILVRGDSLMSGYWNMPEETACSMRGGYFRTGDIAHVDSEGNLFIVDRAKDMIITGGENVFCPDVEGALMKHPAVKEAAVIGVPDEQWGEAVKCFVILRSGSEVTTEDLRSFCRQYLAGYKIPKSFEFVDDFPRTSLGKVAKKTLRAPFWEGRDRNVN